jgi:putative transposase
MHQQGIPVVVACRRLNLARSSAYYCPTTHADKSALSRRVVELALEHASFGYRKITHLLRLEGWSVNPKRVYRIWRDCSLKRAPKPKRAKRIRPKVCFQPTVPDRAGQVWAMDFLHDYMEEGRRYRIFNILDVFSRFAFEPLVETSITGKQVAEHLELLFATFGPPKVLRCDGGPEFQSRHVRRLLNRFGVRLEVIPPGQPYSNGHIESFNGLMRSECLERELPADIIDARRFVGLWVFRYNQARPHSALRYRTPAEVWADNVTDGGNPNIMSVVSFRQACANWDASRQSR